LSKIVSIKETSFPLIPSGRDEYDGYVISLEDGEQVKMGISNTQSCCENWGYLTSEDNLEEFVGAELISVGVVDEALNVKDIPAVYDGGVMFINVYTSSGMFQFIAYNEHDGYYSHDAVLIVRDRVEGSEYL
jgi:hypothetical protein